MDKIKKVVKLVLICVLISIFAWQTIRINRFNQKVNRYAQMIIWDVLFSLDASIQSADNLKRSGSDDDLKQLQFNSLELSKKLQTLNSFCSELENPETLNNYPAGIFNKLYWEIEFHFRKQQDSTASSSVIDITDHIENCTDIMVEFKKLLEDDSVSPIERFEQICKYADEMTYKNRFLVL